MYQCRHQPRRATANPRTSIRSCSVDLRLAFSREKQIKGSQRPDRDRHQTATPPRRSPSMPSLAPWSRTSPPDPDLTSGNVFINSALRGGSQQAVAVLAVQGCQGRLMARSKAEIRAIIMRVTRVVVRAIGTRARRIYEKCSAITSVQKLKRTGKAERPNRAFGLSWYPPLPGGCRVKSTTPTPCVGPVGFLSIMSGPKSTGQFFFFCALA